jgi:hypothetical protein
LEDDKKAGEEDWKVERERIEREERLKRAEMKAGGKIVQPYE